jgi:hypothetical protein
MLKQLDHYPLSPSQHLAPQGQTTSWLKLSQRFKPATLAVLVQLASIVVVVLISSMAALLWQLSWHSNIRVPMWCMVVMQALCAMQLSRKLAMARWWSWIHFIFPLGIWSLSQLAIPSEIYLFGFIVSLSLFWTTFRTQVPFFPSRPIIRPQIVDILPKQRAIRMIDIGSGLGDLVMHIAHARQESEITGIEIAPLPWSISRLRAWCKGSSAHFKLGDYRSLDFANYDVIFAYLSPAAMLALWHKAQAEMRAGSMLISYEFEIPGAVPSQVIASGENVPKLYVWRIE